MSMQYWDPFEEMFNRYTSGRRSSWQGSSMGRTLPVDICETNDEFIVRAAVPGINPDDLEITVKEDVLTITGTLGQSDWMQQHMQHHQGHESHSGQQQSSQSSHQGQKSSQSNQGQQSHQGQQSQQGQQMDQGQESSGAGYYCWVQEIPTGKFSRSFTLPTELNGNDSKAEFDNGMLVLHLPKAEAAKPRRIQVSAGSGRQQHEQLPVGQGSGQSQGQSQGNR